MLFISALCHQIRRLGSFYIKVLGSCGDEVGVAEVLVRSFDLRDTRISAYGRTVTSVEDALPPKTAAATVLPDPPEAEAPPSGNPFEGDDHVVDVAADEQAPGKMRATRLPPPGAKAGRKPPPGPPKPAAPPASPRGRARARTRQGR
eukprot:jgi/Tetstr1/453352/TSEL_040343.t1